MPLESVPPRPPRSALRKEEERVWVGFYQRVGRDPAMAADVMAQLEADPLMKRQHLGLYLRCKAAQRRHKERQARHKRVGLWLRSSLRTVLLGPVLALEQFLASGWNLLLASLPAPKAEPANSQARRLARQPGFSAARASFEQEGGLAASSRSDRHPGAAAPGDREAA